MSNEAAEDLAIPGAFAEHVRANGSMSSIYRATQRSLKWDVAIYDRREAPLLARLTTFIDADALVALCR